MSKNVEFVSVVILTLVILILVILVIIYTYYKGLKVNLELGSVPDMLVDKYLLYNSKALWCPISRWCDYIIQYRYNGSHKRLKRDILSAHKPKTFLMIPDSNFITHKAKLATLLKGSNITPVSYSLPEEYHDLYMYCNRSRTEDHWVILKKSQVDTPDQN